PDSTSVTMRRSQMRQPKTAEVRLDEHKEASFGPAGPRILPFWPPTSRLRSNFVAAEPPGTEDRDQQLWYPGNGGLAAGSYSQHRARPIGRPMGRCGREVRAQIPLQSGGRSDKATRNRLWSLGNHAHTLRS